MQKGLDMAGGTHRERTRERQLQERKKRERYHKEQMIKKKKEEIQEKQIKMNEEQETLGDAPQDMGDPLDRYNQSGGEHTSEQKIEQGSSTSKTDLEEELGELEKERKDLDKISLRERANQAVATAKKMRRSTVRGIRVVGLAIKFWPVTLVISLLIAGFILLSSTFVMVVIPAAAYIVLTDDEGGDLAVSNPGISVEEVEESNGGEVTEEGTNSGEVINGAAWPVPYTKHITSYFGPRWGRNHNGIDVAWQGVGGQDIVAYQDGKVIESRYVSWWGYYVRVQHGDNLQTIYAHMYKPGIANGTEVKAGQKLGGVGTTGNSTGNHLHFEILEKQPNGKYKAVNPMPYLEGLR